MDVNIAFIGYALRLYKVWGIASFITTRVLLQPSIR